MTLSKQTSALLVIAVVALAGLAQSSALAAVNLGSTSPAALPLETGVIKIAKGGKQGSKHRCGQFGKANHCKARNDKRSKSCVCIG
jgi:hypothetical protein